MKGLKKETEKSFQSLWQREEGWAKEHESKGAEEHVTALIIFSLWREFWHSVEVFFDIRILICIFMQLTHLNFAVVWSTLHCCVCECTLNLERSCDSSLKYRIKIWLCTSARLFNIRNLNCRTCKNILASQSWRMNYFAIWKIRSQLLLLVCTSNFFQRENFEINLSACSFCMYSSWSSC